MTASPTNFNRPAEPLDLLLHARRRARAHILGIAFSDAAVKPTRSRTEMILRSSAADRGASAIAAPHDQQKRTARLSSPHVGQAGIHRV
jgi:hypothetical protein